MNVTNKHVSVFVFSLALMWLIFFPPIGTTEGTYCPEYIPGIVLRGEEIPGETHLGYVQWNFYAFGPMLRLREVERVHAKAGVPGPYMYSVFGVLFIGNLVGLVSLTCLGAFLWRVEPR